MKIKSIQKIFILTILTILLIGIVCATEINNNNDTTTTTTITTKDTDSATTLPNERINKKSVHNIKTAGTKTVNVKSSASLTKELKETRTTSKSKIIKLKKGTYTITTPLSLKNQKYKTITILGNGATISGSGKNKFLTINKGFKVTIKNVKIKNFKSTKGGAITNQGNLILYNSTFEYNKATKGVGGAILNKGNLNINKCIFNKNTVYANTFGDGGGAIYNNHSLIVKNSTFSNNFGNNASGGAICIGGDYYNPCRIRIDGNFFNNKATSCDYDGLYDTAGGGAIFSYDAPMNVTGTFINNTANDGGAIRIMGGGHIKGTFINNVALGCGGAICEMNLDLIEGTFINNSAYGGGAISCRGCKIIGNFINNTAEGGGAIDSMGSIEVEGNFSGNVATKLNGGAISAGYYPLANIKGNFIDNRALLEGGAISLGSVSDEDNIIKGTFINNQAQNGGAISSLENVKINANFIKNRATEDGGALYIEKSEYEYFNPKINGNFVSNNAKLYGGAIYTTANQTKINAKFNKNSVYGNLFEKPINEGIINGGEKCTISSNNKNKQNTGYSGTIYNSGNNCNIYANYTSQTATEIKLNTQHTNSNNIVKITGTLKQSNTKTISNAKIKLNINNKIITVKTNNKGTFTYSYKARNKGVNIVIATYNGNKNILGTTNITTFKTTKSATKITINNIPTTSKGKTITITGKFTDETGTLLKNTQLTLNINGKKYKTKTDKNGKYTYKYKTTKTGTNKITITYAGNTKYAKTSAQKKFTVTNYKMITLYMKSSANYGTTKYINGDPFVAHYTYVNGQYDRGVYAEIDSRGLSHPTVNKIVKTTFYYKNAKGQLITRTGTKSQYNPIFKAPIISGYTPYKVDIYYQKRS
ncbi:Ig-like domain repeat protein (plasmid) [Methanosphaera sp. ISO3-F5]|uniref:Ig-like domain repeat protein n=1 Tax=Methanosphaera sp. ISO3-F5 TaxID=1452353 RepID=UPI002B25B009|nr:Ig-like domain repeat protein [Methanosphaera sp. ISO3-F5]WQH65428.1 hypothetical protein PXD04_11135 [Methanosphaera sp. ISO3-F5]